MNYEPKQGLEFPLEAKVIEARTRNTVEKTRAKLALIILGTSLLVLAITGAVSFFAGDFRPLQTLWSILAMPLGAIIAHYFGKAEKNDENHDKSPA